METEGYRDRNGNTIRFTLPNKVSTVESPLSWIRGLSRYIDPGNRNGPYSLQDHLRSRCTSNVHDDLSAGTMETVTRKYNSDNPQYCKFYAVQLNEAVKLTVCGQLEDALKKFDVLDIVDITSTLDSNHSEALSYAVDALKWSIMTLKNIQDEKDFEDVGVAELFNLRWARLQHNTKCRAVFAYLQGKLGAFLNITEEKQLELFKDAVGWEPDHHIWHSAVYKIQRQIRRNLGRQQKGELDPPCEEERRFCQEAFRLAPGIYCNVKRLAILLKDTLRCMTSDLHGRLWPEDEYERCKGLLKQALDIATRQNQATWIGKSLLRLSDVMLDPRAPKSDQLIGKNLLEQCLQANPMNSHVLHRIAKYYSYSFPGIYPKDHKQALNLYERAFDADPGNYPCVKDYLKFLAFKEVYQKYVKVCDAALAETFIDYRIASLLISKGCVLWIFTPINQSNPRQDRVDACETWLNVVNNFPGYLETLLKTIRSPPFRNPWRKPDHVRIDIGQITATLEDMKRRCAGEQQDRANSIAKFLDELRANAN